MATIPVKPGEKQPLLSSWRRYQEQLPTPGQLCAWFDGRKAHNVGIVTGWHGLTVLDFDRATAYARWLLWAARQGRFSVAGWVARTAYRVATARGVHVYVWLGEAERSRHLQGIDVKGKGGYVVGEGSTHPSGAVYTALTPCLSIPHVPALGDILPAALVLRQDQPGHVTPPSLPPGRLPAGSANPWHVACGEPAPKRTPASLVARIKSRLRIESFFTEIDRTSSDGRWLRTRRPLHDDEHPSFWLDTQLQISGCFASCTPKPLDVIDLFARLYGLSNRDAIRELSRRI